MQDQQQNSVRAGAGSDARGWTRGPCCIGCGGRSARAVRTQSAEVGGHPVYYLTYVWACSVCGAEWLDAALSRLNEWSADAARLAAHKVERTSDWLFQSA
jgi:hypothetical protein